jgi:hypothetical protein
MATRGRRALRRVARGFIGAGKTMRRRGQLWVLPRAQSCAPATIVGWWSRLHSRDAQRGRRLVENKSERSFEGSTRRLSASLSQSQPRSALTTMSVPDDALRKVPSPPPAPQSPTNAALLQVVVQLQGQQVEASRQLNTVRQQLNGRERERKLNTLTLREIEELPRGAAAVTCYRGVGRM